jgi:hypothetical protein
MALARATNVLDDVFDRALPEIVTVKRTDRAKRAIELAAATVLHQPHRGVSLAVKYRAIGDDACKVWEFVTFIHWLQAVLARIFEHLAPDALGISFDYRVGVLESLIGKKRGVVATNHDRDASLPILSCDLVGPARGICFDGHRDEVRLFFNRNTLESLVVERRFHVARRQRFQDGEAERLHRIR